ncbi:hypothetical protein EXIGLDRAFT_719984, partial [Exidia glandulosa HHB12029]
MAQDPKSTRFRRIVRAQSDFDALAARVADLERTHADAVHTFNNARTIMNDAAAELNQARAKLLVSQDEVSGLRRSYRRDAMQRMPVDILRWIFSEAVALPVATRHAVQADACWLLDCAQMPFTLAAVCAKWRSIALLHPAIWTYVSIPPPAPAGGLVHLLHTLRIDLVLLRSASAPLDIMINLFHAREGDWNEMDRILMSMIGKHCCRWRIFEMWLPDEVGFPEELDVLKGPLPLLERICIVNDHQEDGGGANYDYLPFVPKLREAVLWGPSSLDLTRQPSFPRLVSLSLHEQPPLPRLWCMLEAAASTLQYLLLSFKEDGITSSWQCTALSLPNLHTFVTDTPHDALLSRICNLQLPRLRCLRLHPIWTDRAAFIGWLEPLKDSVTTLSLCGNVGIDDLEALKVLSNVEELLVD